MTVNPRTILFAAVSLFLASQALAQTTAVARPHRWVDWQSASLDSRYRLIENSEGRTTVNQMQGRETLQLGIKIDEEER